MTTRYKAFLPVLAAPVLALVMAFVVTSLVLVVAGDPVVLVWQTILSRPDARNVVNVINSGAVLYLSGIAAAIGFRMKLFNIGVDGQYRIAAFVAAWVAGEAWLPGLANTALALIAAVLVGSLWAGVAGVLRVTRGVHEVISTIMLNFIATFLVAFLLRKVAVTEGNQIGTEPVPEGSRIPGLQLIPGAPDDIYGLVLLAVVVGIAYGVVLNRTRFGFELRATGQSPSAAMASGISVKKMTVVAMLLSGGVAGLIGMPLLFGEYYNYGVTFQPGLGFAGIAVALLGRNHPVGVAFGAVLFAYLDEQGNKLQIFANVSPELVLIIQGVIVMSVVIAYEAVQRYVVRTEEKMVGVAVGEGLDAGDTGSPRDHDETREARS
jgi:general nucleoside transport system permease protein